MNPLPRCRADDVLLAHLNAEVTDERLEFIKARKSPVCESARERSVTACSRCYCSRETEEESIKTALPHPPGPSALIAL